MSSTTGRNGRILYITCSSSISDEVDRHSFRNATSRSNGSDGKQEE